MRKIISLLIVILMIAPLIVPLKTYATFTPPFEITSKAAYMVNLDTDTVVYEKNRDQQIVPASLVKIMTAIIAIEQIKDLEGTVITAPPYIFDELFTLNASTADIRPNEKVRAIDILYALMLQSACEAGSILADHIAGSIPKFVDMMNNKAKEIGAKNTVFKDSHGLSSNGQLTTVYDMYLITMYALKSPIFEKICTTLNYKMPATNKHNNPRNIVHTNFMLSKVRGGAYYYQYAKGIKTGTLDERNLVSMASKDGYNYLLVTMGGPFKLEGGGNSSYKDTLSLYKWAFSDLKVREILSTETSKAEVKVELSSKQDYLILNAKEKITAVLPKDIDLTTIKEDITLSKNIKAPIKKGDELGKIKLLLANEVVGETTLVASENVKRNQLLYIIDINKRYFAQGYVLILCILIVLTFVIFLILNTARRKKIAKYRSRIRKGM